MGSTSRAVRAFVAEAVRPDDPEQKKPDPEPTAAAEHKAAVAEGWRMYQAQLMPWKVFLAAFSAGIIVHNEQYGFGLVYLVPALAIASYLFTDFRLERKSIANGRTEKGQRTGRRILRIRRRAMRSGAVGAAIGVWLVLVSVTSPPGFPPGLFDLPGVVVWWGGVAVWACAAWDGWWRPAEETAEAPPEHGTTMPAPPVPVPAPRPAPPTPTPVPPAPRDDHPLPPPAVLRRTAPADRTVNADDRTTQIQKILDDQGKLGTVVGMVVGPTTIRYHIDRAQGVKVQKILALKNDFGVELKTRNLRFLAPIEGVPYIGIEVPRAPEDRDVVPLGEVLASAAAKQNSSVLLVGLGKDTQGRPVIADLARAPHVIVAGATGAGKSECINAIMCSFLSRATPKQVKFLLVDLKRVELTAYQDIPHLVSPVVTDAEQAANALRWAVREMEGRYARLAAAGARDIDDYNARKLGPHMSKLVILVDELAALMITGDDTVEPNLVRLTQEGRAAGVHAILATQRPSVDVVTGLIKANVPARLAFMTTSRVDSQVVLDEPGAEKLLGRGDALWRESGVSAPVRLQGSLVTTPEIGDLVDYWRSQGPAGFIPTIDVDPPGSITPPPEQAHERVLKVARRLRDHDGTVHKQQIVDATPGMKDATRNAAITRLFNSGELRKTGSNAKYLVPDEGAEEDAGGPTG